jgi:hypothetical protein
VRVETAERYQAILSRLEGVRAKKQKYQEAVNNATADADREKAQQFVAYWTEQERLINLTIDAER